MPFLMKALSFLSPLTRPPLRAWTAYLFLAGLIIYFAMDMLNTVKESEFKRGYDTRTKEFGSMMQGMLDDAADRERKQRQALYDLETHYEDRIAELEEQLGSVSFSVVDDGRVCDSENSGSASAGSGESVSRDASPPAQRRSTSTEAANLATALVEDAKNYARCYARLKSLRQAVTQSR